MNTFDLKKYLSEGRLYEEGEDQFENDLAIAGNKLADEIEDELENKDVEINEIATVVGILGYVLLSNTVANMLSKTFKSYLKNIILVKVKPLLKNYMILLIKMKRHLKHLLEE